MDGCTNSKDIEVEILEEIPVEVDDNIKFCEGETIQFNVSLDGENQFSWTGPNGFSSTELNPVITNATAADAGEYKLVIENEDGCAVEKIVTVQLKTNCGGECVEPLLSNLVVIETTCGDANGSAAIMVVGDEEDYDYAWSPSVGVSNTDWKCEIIIYLLVLIRY